MFTRAVYARTALVVSHRACVKLRLRSLTTYPPRMLNDEYLFAYTSGRFLYNEQAIRHGSVQFLTKLSEGGFNRVLLATMEDGFKAIVKIPFWVSAPRTYATASEVATLSFLRSKGVPVPEVYGWSSTMDNPIGVEYIVMEHVAGVGADTRWFDNNKYQKHALVTGIVDVEKRLFSIPFGAVGSIYFKRDVEPRFQAPLYEAGTADEDGDGEVYCIGPSADYMFWYGQSGLLELDRGPWRNPQDYLIATAEKEAKWTDKYGKPLESDFPHNTVFPGVRQPRDYLVLLKKYQSIAPYLLPKELSRPTLRHPDLTPSNVFICPDTFKVTSIIDWQHAVVTPLVLAAGYPKIFENPDPEPPTGLIPPKYPPEYDTMSPDEKDQVDDLIRRQSLFYLYRVFNGGLNKLHLQALQDPLILQRQQLVDFAGRQWSGNLISLRGALMRMRDLWPHLSSPNIPHECPIEFSAQEIREQTENEPMWYDLNMLVSHWRGELGGLSEEGWLPGEKYDVAVQRNESLREEFSAGGSPDELEAVRRGWPFQDREEFY